MAAAAAVAALGSADAFIPSPVLPVSRATRRAMSMSRLSMAATAAPKPGTGKNRMTETGFTTPLVERIELPGTTQGFEYRVRTDLDILEKKLNVAERLKVEKAGLSALDELNMLAAEAKSKGGAQHCDDMPSVNTRLKWLGLFHRDKHMPGGFMWRMRCPNGSYSLDQWKEILKVMEHPDYQNYKGKDMGEKDMWKQGACLTITTRQNIQLYGIRLENMPEHWEALRGAGVFSLQAGMDNVRNLVGNPIAGIDPEELVDTRPFCDEFTAKLTNNGNGNPEFANLPRKFNVCYIGSKEMYEHPDINDIAYLPSKGPNGEMGWHIEVGGLLTSTLCEFAVPLNAWVPQDKHWELGAAILTTFRDFGYRYNPRTKCRLMYLINDMGIDGFRAEVAKRYKDQTGSDLPTADGITKLVPETWKRRELLGAHEQVDGKNWLGLHVPAGRFYADELKELVEICDSYGAGEMRMTVESNLILPHIPADKIDAVRAAVKAKLPRITEDPATIAKGSVSCTGTQFCGQSKINTKGNTVKFAEMMDAKFDFPEGKDVRVHWTGCPNTCAQVQIGDIGLLGTNVKDSTGTIVEGVDIYTGGGIGQTGAIGSIYKKGVPITESLEEELSKLLVEQFGAVPKGAGGGAAVAESGGFLDGLKSMIGLGK